MAKKVAPTKLISGQGFVFEDYIAAYFLSCLLSGHPPLEPGLGTLTRIDFQTRVDGWFPDDILLTLVSPGVERKCAFSIKSNQQFTKKSAPKDFVNAAWEQFLHEGSDQFQESRDRLGLITAPQHFEVSTHLQKLLQQARDQDPKLLPDRLQKDGFAHKIQRDLFKSFACPQILSSKHLQERTLTGGLLLHVIVLEFDFEREPSRNKQQAVENCRSALKSGSLDDALSLWENLLSIARDNKRAGYLDLTRLLSFLRRQYQLRDHPEFSADWSRLLTLTKSNFSLIPDKIGSVVSLLRLPERNELKDRITKSRAVILRGPSGCGKTVLAKLWAEEESQTNKVLWWNAGSFDAQDFQTFETHLRLAHSLHETMRSASSSNAYTIVDGLDRVFSDQAFRNLSILIQALELNLETSPWRLLLTCQPEEWERIQLKLARVNISTFEWAIFDIDSPREIDAVLKIFPTLRGLTLQPQLKSLLMKPKVLDLLATKLSTVGSIDTSRWVGESDLIDWFWKTEIQSSASASFLKLLGEKQADELQSEIPDTEFSIADLAPIDGLIQDRICGKRDEQFYFYHDLYGDWSRQRMLMSKANKLREYVEPRLSSPLWHRALRLYSLHLLEQNEDLTKWRAILNEFSVGNESGNLAQDLILDSIIFAANPKQLLERIWNYLLDTDGILLRRLLTRFLQVATLPNPIITKAFRENLNAETATILRVPYWPYWIPILQVLHRHLEEVSKRAPALIAKIADTWLRQGGENWLLRQEAAELALAVGYNALHFVQRGGFVGRDDEFLRIVFRAALAGANELPEKVAKFALEASCRSLHQAEETATEEEQIEANKKYTTPIYPFRSRALPLPPPWPDGPKKLVDDDFRKVCMDADSIVPLIKAKPSAAREVLLACLLEEPKPYEPQRYTFRSFEGIIDNYEWYPPLYIRGPLLSFLKLQPTEGLELVLRLVNFATERWASKQVRPYQIVNPFPEGECKWFGGKNVYFWFRNDSSCPDIVVVALMALEKWLYDELDAKRPINHIIETILRRSKSMAFAGVLSSVGRKEPSLFQNILKPLFAVPELYIWKDSQQDHVIDCLMIGWSGKVKWLSDLAREWHSLPHRRVNLRDQALYLYLNAPQIQPFFDQSRQSWIKRFESESEELKVELEQLIPLFDVNNYKVETFPTGEKGWLFRQPQELKKKNQQALEADQQHMILSWFPDKCWRLLTINQSLAESEIEPFWDDLQRISGFTANVSDNPMENAICGGIAVLLCLNRDWLKQNSEREQWCRQKLIQIIQTSPPPKESGYETDGEWDRFCAQAIPVLWAEEPESILLRECVARLATHHHYQTVQLLFSSVALYRDKLGEHFKQLQHLTLRWAATKWKYRHEHYNEEKSFDLESWLSKEIHYFINGVISPDIPPWDHLLEERPQVLQSSIEAAISEHTQILQDRRNDRSKRYRKAPNINLELIQAIYSWLPTLEQARDKEERAEWIIIWQRILGCSLDMLGEEVEGEVKIDGTPYEWDYWVLEKIAHLVLQLHPTEQPENFWEPLLTLSGPGHYWVEKFLRTLFIYGLYEPQLTEAFINQWRAMIDFAFSSSKWQFGNAWRDYELSWVWCNLLGMFANDQSLWKDDHEQSVYKMRDYYMRWASHCLELPHCVVRFADFLRRPAAECLLFEGLIWLEKVISHAQDRFWDEHNMQDSLAALLDYSWSTKSENLKGQPDAFVAFRKILKKLADLQNVIALEIQQHMIAFH
jgi:hypothetical protein